MKKYNKVYGFGEAPMRFAIWNKAYDFAQEHNAKGLSWTCGVNQFSDLTKEEFSAMYLGYNWNPNRERKVQLLDETNLATTVDWRTEGAVTPIKNQGQCGSCWSFSTTGALEGLHFINNGTLLSFSEQQLVDCSSSYGNDGCNGGLMDDAFKYVEAKGVELESTYPYTAASGTCKYSASKTVFKNKGYSDVTVDSPTQLQAAVNKGPVSIAIEADQSAFQQYTSGIISSNCGTNLDHGVLIVGYGSNYWIVKNSWGTSWGMQGYVNIATGTQNSGKGVCGINSDPSYPTL
jgi:C1A family cysteine protease